MGCPTSLIPHRDFYSNVQYSIMHDDNSVILISSLMMRMRNNKMKDNHSCFNENNDDVIKYVQYILSVHSYWS